MAAQAAGYTAKQRSGTDDKEQLYNDTLAHIQALGSLDITADEGDWYRYGQGLANDFGEEGRQLFHLLSRHYPNYTEAETDRKYTAILREPKRPQGLTARTVIWACRQWGAQPEPQHRDWQQDHSDDLRDF